MQNLNANENSRLIEAAEAIVAPVLEVSSPRSESLFSGPVDSNVGLAFAPVAPALAPAQ